MAEISVKAVTLYIGSNRPEFAEIVLGDLNTVKQPAVDALLFSLKLSKQQQLIVAKKVMTK